MDSALEGADIVFYNATTGLEEYAGYKALGIPQGAHIMYIAERVKEICPNAWFLVNTNPPDVPLAAVHKKFNLNKVIGCCNATVISKKVLFAYLCANNYKSKLSNDVKFTENDLQLHEIGVNHDLWFYDISLKGKSIYNDLRESLPKDYNENILRTEYLDSFPEWKFAFKNNIELLKYTNYLPAPVGGSRRYSGLPLSGNEMGKMMKRPSREDFQRCINEKLEKEEIMSIISRCGGGIPAYIADVIEAILTDSVKECSVQVINNGVLPCFPKDAMLQMSCKLGRNGLERPVLNKIPEFIIGVIASRIYQNDMAARALAEQDEHLMVQAMLMMPERVTTGDAFNAVNSKSNVEPIIPLN